MEKHVVDSSLLIPRLNWDRLGTWQKTLDDELAALPSDIRRMCIKSTTVITQVGFPYAYNLQAHSRGGQWTPVPKMPGYEYCWETVDGMGFDELNIYGPFDAKLLKRIIEKFERKGLKIIGRWEMLITFGK